MEIKAELKQPYTEEARIEFIVEQNHKLGYEIKEVEDGLQAWGLTEEDNINLRKQYFFSQFIVTSLGNFRLQPKGYANAQQAMDVINTMATVSGGLTEQLTNLIIFYPTPDFTVEEQCTEEWLVANQIKPNIMTLAEWQKFYLEFCQLYAMQQYKSEVVNENTTNTTTDVPDEVEAEPTRDVDTNKN